MWYCEVCKKDVYINTKSSQIKSTSHIQTENFSRINGNLTDTNYTNFKLENDQADHLVETTIDDCTQFFHRLKYKCDGVKKN